MSVPADVTGLRNGLRIKHYAIALQALYPRLELEAAIGIKCVFLSKMYHALSLLALCLR